MILLNLLDASTARAAERASKHARRINERLERDVPLLLHAGVVAPVTSREAAARLDRRAQHEAEKQAAEHAETLVAVEQLVAHGAASPSGDLRAWLASWLPRITRTRRHHGNHRYVFALSRAAKRVVPASLPYPKFDARACRAMGVTPDLCPSETSGPAALQRPEPRPTERTFDR